MIPFNFDYRVPDSLEEAVRLLENDKTARILAGGLSILTAMKFHRVTPSVLVDLRKIKSLRGIGRQKTGGALRIGAMTPYVEIAASGAVKERYQALAEALNGIGDPQVRNRGTIGGSLSYNEPAADLSAVALALEAVILTLNPDGNRTIPVNEFIAGAFKTSLRPAEIVTSVEFPEYLPGTGSAYEKLRDSASGFAICGVAAMVQIGPDSTVNKCRVAVTGAADHASRLNKVESALETKKSTSENLAQAAESIAEERLKFRSDHAASGEYRAHLVEVITVRALTSAVQRAGVH